MSVTIQIVGSVSGVPTPYDGLYLAGDYTPAEHDFGELEATPDRTKARVFADAGEALEFWRQEHPQGMGGQNFGGANRPLTFFTVTVEKVPDE